MQNDISELKLKILGSLVKSSYSEEPKPYRFTGSAMPVCQRAVALFNTSVFKNNVTPKQQYALESGTVYHKIIQTWLSNSGLLFGKYKDSFGNVFPKPQYKELTREEEKTYLKENKILPKYDKDNYNLVGSKKPLFNKDNTPMEYVEWRVYDKKSKFTGLIDGILNLNGKYALCDFKFVGDWSFNHYRNEGISENNGYSYQLNSYRYNLGKVFDEKGNRLHISDTMYLIIFNRERFFNTFSMNDLLILSIPYKKESYRSQRKLYLKSIEKINEKDYKYFSKDCSARCNSISDCGFCKAKNLCFGVNNKKNIKKLLKESWGL